MNIITLDSCKSTNLEARQLLDAEDTCIAGMPADFVPDVITSRKQTQGKTRNGATWFSPEDCGIYMSVIRPYRKDIYVWLIAERVAALLRNYFQVCIHSYWLKDNNNDIHINHTKLAGILCEYHAASDKLIVGVGLNTFRPSEKKIRKDLLQSATWLNEWASESRIDHAKLVNMIAEEIIKI